jgi:prenylcysteine oxidase/farnesylcysteine lyase
MDATAEFNLDADTQGDEDESQTLGIWNGETFVFTQSSASWAWWDTTKLLWKYGMSPIRTNNLMKSTIAKFLKLYEAPFFPFRSLSERAVELDLVGTTGLTGAQLLEQNKIYAPFTTDIIQASTRVNYGQNLGLIHGLETMVCMAIEGAMQVKGGNWQIFDRMLNASGATVLLDTAVTSLLQNKGVYTLISAPASATSETATLTQQFDTVILAAPLQFSGIKIADGLVRKLPDEIPYVKLHVTLFASPLKLNGAYFNLKPSDVVPDTILTTLSPSEDWSSRKDIVGKSGFFSISTLRRVLNPHTNSTNYLYKIFSPTPIEPSFLASLFGVSRLSLPDDLDDLKGSPTESITWYYPKVFYSYPYEYPRVTFEEAELARGLWYTSGIESFISTMETSALMGKNVAQLVMDDYLEVLGAEKGGEKQKNIEEL